MLPSQPTKFKRNGNMKYDLWCMIFCFLVHGVLSKFVAAFLVHLKILLLTQSSHWEEVEKKKYEQWRERVINKFKKKNHTLQYML